MDEALLLYAKGEIARYVAARPGCADTVEGVHQWWISWPGAAAVAVTLAALQQLQCDGVVQGLRVGDRELWRRPRAGAA